MNLFPTLFVNVGFIRHETQCFVLTHLSTAMRSKGLGQDPLECHSIEVLPLFELHCAIRRPAYERASYRSVDCSPNVFFTLLFMPNEFDTACVIELTEVFADGLQVFVKSIRDLART